MTTNAAIRDVVDLTREISDRGPSAPEYDGLRVFQHRWRAIKFLTGRGSEVSPITIDTWPSLSCNARCPLCPYKLSGARDEVDRSDVLSLMDENLASEVLSGAAGFGVRSVILTGGGDPLLHPGVVNIARTARRVGLQWAMFTNGLRLDARLAEALLQERPTFLRVSLDAGTAEEHARVYALPESAFHEIVHNVVTAGVCARRHGLRSVGMSFTLLPTVTDSQLTAIWSLLRRVLQTCGNGLGLVAFRPRLIHYQRRLPLCPQPHPDGYLSLAERIERIIIQPARREGGHSTAFDLKKGLFVLAARRYSECGCLSSGWMTTIDQKGRGFITAELAGAEGHDQIWGSISGAGDFEDLWCAPHRRHLHRKLVSGEIHVPLVHRTSPVDAFLRRLIDVTGGPVEAQTATAMVEAVAASSCYRSGNPDFV